MYNYYNKDTYNFDKGTGTLSITSNSKAKLSDILAINPALVHHLHITKTFHEYIDLSVYHNLKTLDISHLGGIDTIDLRCADKLHRVKITNCPVKELLLPDSVISLNVRGSDISVFDVHENITDLMLFKNNIKDIDLSKCVNLYALNIGDNCLTSIDVSKNRYLQKLNISYNRIHGLLNLSNNPCINALNMNDNFIDYIWLHPNIERIPSVTFGNNLITYNERDFVKKARSLFDNGPGFIKILDSI